MIRGVIKFSRQQHSSFLYTVHAVITELIENLARTLELPILVMPVSQLRAEENLLPVLSPPNLKLEIQDVLAPFSIISVSYGIRLRVPPPKLNSTTIPYATS